VFADKFKNPESNIKTTAGTENNKNIIDAIFGNLPAQEDQVAATSDTERDRRIRMREMERLRRVVGAPTVDGKYYPKEGE